MNYIENEIYLKDIHTALQQTIGMESLKEKSIVVFGATGLIGSFLVDCLRIANATKHLNMRIIASGRNREKLEKRFGANAKIGMTEEATVEYLVCDVSELTEEKLSNIIPLSSVDFFVHAASYGHPRAFRETPVEVMLANLLGTHRVLEMARKNPKSRVLYVSSGEVQEEVNHLSVRACYPESKRAAETLCLSFLQEYQTDVVIARPCHTFGANVTVEDNRATAQFIENAVQGQPIVLKSAGEQIRSFSYVSDCVSGLLTILTCGKPGVVYGVAGGEACSIREFAGYCAKSAGTQVQFLEGTEAEKAEATPIVKQIVDNEELKALGWKPVYTIQKGIEHSVMIRKHKESN